MYVSLYNISCESIGDFKTKSSSFSNLFREVSSTWYELMLWLCQLNVFLIFERNFIFREKMSVFTSCKLTVPTIVDTDTSLTTDTGSDVTETDIATQADLSDENTETESVCATVTNSNTPTSELSEREVRVLHI